MYNFFGLIYVGGGERRQSMPLLMLKCIFKFEQLFFRLPAYVMNPMQQTQVNSNKNSSKAVAKAWLKTLTLACSYSAQTGKKTTWNIADLALKVETRWINHPQYNLKALSHACGISEKRLKLLAKTAEFFPPQERFSQLSVTHHIEVVRRDPEKANYWLQQACEKQWSGKDLGLAIAGDGDPKKFSWLRCGTFWFFTRCDPRFGIKYPGRIPGQIPANVIHYFTEPDDLVVDLMAGGGCTLDVAKYLGRRCLAYDLTSVRPDIQKNDALTGIPSEAHGAKLIFLDPPYGTIAKRFYEKHPSCLSQMNQTDFLNALNKVAEYSHKALLANGYLAILVQNVYEWEGDTVFQIMQKLTNTQWKLVRRIQVPLPNQHISSSVMKWARETCQMVNTDRDLLIFQMN